MRRMLVLSSKHIKPERLFTTWPMKEQNIPGRDTITPGCDPKNKTKKVPSCLTSKLMQRLCPVIYGLVSEGRCFALVNAPSV